MIERFEKAGVVPVVVLDKAEDAVPLGRVLLDNGIDVIEVTCRTPAAMDAITALARELPNLLVGAGTVLTTEAVARVADAGAKFMVAPGCNDDVVRAGLKAGLAVTPGVMTPSEIERAYGLGCTLLKFFPAGAAGGVPMLKALTGPYGHLGLRFIPTGGVNADNLADYLALPCVAAVGGSWIVKRDLIADHNWDEIARRVQAARRTCEARNK